MSEETCYESCLPSQLTTIALYRTAFKTCCSYPKHHSPNWLSYLACGLLECWQTFSPEHVTKRRQDEIARKSLCMIFLPVLFRCGQASSTTTISERVPLFWNLCYDFFFLALTGLKFLAALGCMSAYAAMLIKKSMLLSDTLSPVYSRCYRSSLWWLVMDSHRQHPDIAVESVPP